MPPADSSQEEGGLYQPPRPPLPAPTPYTHPTPAVLPPTPVRLPFATGAYSRHVTPSTASTTSSIPSTGYVGVPLPGLTSGPPPAFHTAHPLPLGSRYQPFQPTPEYRPPPNPRIGAAGLPPSAISSAESSTSLSFIPPLGGPGSLSCPTSLSLQGVQNTSQPRTSASGLSAGTTVPGPGCWSLPRDSAGAPQDTVDAPVPSPNHSKCDSVPVSLSLGTEELKTRSLPTRCLHGSRPPGLPRRSPFLLEGERNVGGGGGGAASSMAEEDGFLFNEPVPEEEEDLYGSSEDLSSGSSILEKLMVWAYYNTEDPDENDSGTSHFELFLHAQFNQCVFI